MSASEEYTRISLDGRAEPKEKNSNSPTYAGDSEFSEIELSDFRILGNRYTHPRVPNLIFESNTLNATEVLKRSQFLLKHVTRHPKALNHLVQAARKPLTLRFVPFNDIAAHATCTINEFEKIICISQDRRDPSFPYYDFLYDFIFELINSTWTFPDINNLPLKELLKLFPTADHYATAIEAIEYKTYKEITHIMHGWPKLTAALPPNLSFDEYLKMMQQRRACYHGISHYEIYCKQYYKSLNIAIWNELAYFSIIDEFVNDPANVIGYLVSWLNPANWWKTFFRSRDLSLKRESVTSILERRLVEVRKELENLEEISRNFAAQESAARDRNAVVMKEGKYQAERGAVTTEDHIRNTGVDRTDRNDAAETFLTILPAYTSLPAYNATASTAIKQTTAEVHATPMPGLATGN